MEEIEKAADLVVWVCDEAPGFTAGRVQDSAFVGNIVEAMAAYGRGELGENTIPLHSVDRLIVIGSDGMMKAVQQARHGILFPFLKPDHHAIGSINSPMQCMMKEICAQCLQVHKDPVTGEETVVFSCFNQDQPLDHVDFGSSADASVTERSPGKGDTSVDRPLLARYRRARRPSHFRWGGASALPSAFRPTLAPQ